jgi:hypothetical protein
MINRNDASIYIVIYSLRILLEKEENIKRALSANCRFVHSLFLQSRAFYVAFYVGLEFSIPQCGSRGNKKQKA